MARRLEEIEAEIRALPREDRAILLEVLASTLREDLDDVPEISPEWMAEIHRRREEIRRGEAELIDEEDVFAWLRERGLPSP